MIAIVPCVIPSHKPFAKTACGLDSGSDAKYKIPAINPMLLKYTSNVGHNIAAATSPRPAGPSQRDSRIEFTNPNPVSAKLVMRVRQIRGRSIQPHLLIILPHLLNDSRGLLLRQLRTQA